MRKIIFLLVSMSFGAVFAANAQITSMENNQFAISAPETTADGTGDSPWQYGGVAGITLSQVSFTNWAAGGDGSMAFDLMFNYNLNYRKNKHLWQNRLELAYGMNWSQSRGAQKTNDRIYLASMYGYSIGGPWYLAALMNFSTQFANGYNYQTDPKTFMSQFMAPGYLSAGVGIAWHPKKWFTATFSPAMWRGTFVLNDDLSAIGAFGVDPGKRFLNEFGANLRLEVNYDITSAINLYSRLDLFSNYLKNPQNVDVRWDIVMTAKLTKWLAANFTLNMIYDDDIKFPRSDGTMGGARFQLREVFGLGLQAAF